MLMIVFLGVRCFFRAIFIVLMAVSGVERLFERSIAAAGKIERVGTARDDNVVFVQACENLGALFIAQACLHGNAYKGVFDGGMLEVNVSVLGRTLDGLSRDAEHLIFLLANDRAFCRHAGAEIGIWIV